MTFGSSLPNVLNYNEFTNLTYQTTMTIFEQGTKRDRKEGIINGKDGMHHLDTFEQEKRPKIIGAIKGGRGNYGWRNGYNCDITWHITM